MKVLRLWLIVLLAVLLPVRGAMAGAMLCPAMGSGMGGEMRMAEHEHAAAPEAHHHHHDGKGQAGDSAMTAHDQCNLCSAFCSITPLPSAMPGVPPPLEVATASFPGFSVPAPSFVSDGQERPPRSS